MTSRVGGWMTLRSGARFYPLDPRPEDIDVGDIAHALAHKCRYNGHTRKHYSVAEHSLLLSRALERDGEPREVVLWGLLHDATEAFIPDVVKPLKVLPEFAWFREIEARVMAAVCARFGLAFGEPAIVKAYDARIIMDEAPRLMAGPVLASDSGLRPLGCRIRCLEPYRARQSFLARFHDLTRRS
jgi:hypothetical protein